MRIFSRLAAVGLVVAFGLTGAMAAALERYPNAELLMSPEEVRTEYERAEAITSMGGDRLFRIVDVRPFEDFAAGHIPGAVNLPFTRLTDPEAPIDGALRPDRELLDLIGGAGIDKNTRVVLYDDQGGFRAARLFWLLEYFGHQKAAVMNGGLPAWTRAGLDTSKIGDDVKALARVMQMNASPVTFRASVQERRIASADWILSHRHDSEVSVIDVRPTKMFEAGHIPWAQSIPWSGNLAEDGTMLEAQALRTRYEERGITSGRNIVIHCQTGEASAHSYFVLRLLGYPRLRVYHRSWAEWGSDAALPKAAS